VPNEIWAPLCVSAVSFVLVSVFLFFPTSAVETFRFRLEMGSSAELEWGKHVNFYLRFWFWSLCLYLTCEYFWKLIHSFSVFVHSVPFNTNEQGMKDVVHDEQQTPQQELYPLLSIFAWRSRFALQHCSCRFKRHKHQTFSCFVVNLNLSSLITVIAIWLEKAPIIFFLKYNRN
jgi:hypothetical protein